MYQGTTPTIQLTVDGVNLTDCQVYLSMQTYPTQNIITWNSVDSEGFSVFTDPDNPLSSIIRVRLTQEETLKLPPGDVTLQVRWIDNTGYAGASDKAKIDINDVLYKAVLTYQETDPEVEEP